MKIQKQMTLLVMSFLTLLVFTISCNNNDDDVPSLAIDCAIWTNEVNSSLDDFFNAQMLYAATPNNTNCLNLKNKANIYIDTVEDFIDCIPNNLVSDFDEAVANAREAISELDCD